MMYAEDKGKRKLASPGLKASCPLCGNEVIAKCGNVKIWHWAHLAEQSCDDFKEHESEWHRQWKELFPEKNREVIIEKRGNIHVADIRLDNGMVLEFQNSTISFDQIVSRERFYDRMIWVFNCAKGIDRIEISNRSLVWMNPRRDFGKCRKKVYLDLHSRLLLVEKIEKTLDGVIPIWRIFGEFLDKSEFLEFDLQDEPEKNANGYAAGLEEGVYVPDGHGGWKFKRKLTGREWWEYEHIYEAHHG